jgi:hypothetical protein
VEEIENSMNLAKSEERNLPKPSAMLRAADETASRSWLRNLMSAAAPPALVSVMTSRRSSSASCHASSSSYRLAAMPTGCSRFVPMEWALYFGLNEDRRCCLNAERQLAFPFAERSVKPPRTIGEPPRTISEPPRTISEVSRTIDAVSRTSHAR